MFELSLDNMNSKFMLSKLNFYQNIRLFSKLFQRNDSLCILNSKAIDSYQFTQNKLIKISTNSQTNKCVVYFSDSDSAKNKNSDRYSFILYALGVAGLTWFIDSTLDFKWAKVI